MIKITPDKQKDLIVNKPHTKFFFDYFNKEKKVTYLFSKVLKKNKVCIKIYAKYAFNLG